MTETRSYPARARERIKASLIINKLAAHVNGEIDMSPTQIRAASILLNKVLPDLKSVDVKSRIEAMATHRLSDNQLMLIASGALNGKGVPEVIEGQCETVQESLKLVADQ